MATAIKTRKGGALREQLRAAATEAMLDAAEREMIRRGYEHATMQAIAAEAGCAAGTFYLYFKNKEVLFEAMMGRHAKVMFEQARAARARSSDPLEQVRLGLEAIFRYAMHHRPFFRLFLTAMPLRRRAMHQKLSSDTRREQTQYDQIDREALKAAQERGQIRSDVPVEFLQECIASIAMAVLEQFVFSTGKQDPEQQMAILWGLITHGLGARDGK